MLALIQTEWSKIWSMTTTATHQINGYAANTHTYQKIPLLTQWTIFEGKLKPQGNQRSPYPGLPSLLQQRFSSQGSFNDHTASLAASIAGVGSRGAKGVGRWRRDTRGGDPNTKHYKQHFFAQYSVCAIHCLTQYDAQWGQWYTVCRFSFQPNWFHWLAKKRN